MPKGGGGRIQGVYHQKNRTKQTTAKGKQKGSNAVRRAVNRQIPALKRIANGSHTLRRKRRTCDVCGVQGNEDEPPFPVCGGCDARRYCGEACQIADWEAGHARKCG